MMKGKKIAIVTGATGGLGREFVRLLLKEKNVDEIWALEIGRASCRERV